MRKQFFRTVDALLPRWLALFPYNAATWTIKPIMALAFKGSTWKRNSTKNNNFIFGVSDLDLTVVAREKVSYPFFNYCLGIFKSLFIFLGETNLYYLPHLSQLLKRMNCFELQRDPILAAGLSVTYSNMDVEKIVFIQRMLFSDCFALKNEPHLRQLKWRNHFQSVQVQHEGSFIDLDFVLSKLKELTGNHPEICTSLDKWKENFFKPGFNVYESDLGRGFCILVPHNYVWFRSSKDAEFLPGLNAFEKEIIKRQIDWEVWGLSCHKYHLENTKVAEHLSRLKEVYRAISSPTEAQTLFEELELIFNT